MTDELGRGTYRVDVDKTKAEASIKGFESAAKKSGDAVEKAVGKQATGAFGKLDASLKKITQGGGITGAILGGVGIGAGLGVFSAISSGIGMVTDFMGDAIDAASDLAESQSKVNVVFGESADVITDWSEDAAIAMGLSQQAALEAAGTFGNLFDSLGLAEDASVDMSKGIVQLASDLGSFNNVSTEETLLALRSGLLGEAEPMRKFGSALSAARVDAYGMANGLEMVNGKLTETAKVQARYALILEDTTNAQGDFDRTSDGLANTTKTLNAQMADMTAQIGEQLLPYVAQLAKVARDQLVPALQVVIGSIGGVLTLTDLVAKAGRGDLGGLLEMANKFATSSFVDWLNQATSGTEELIETWEGFATEMGTMPDRLTKPFLESLTKTQREALLLVEDLPADLRDALTEGAPEVARGSKDLGHEGIVVPIHKEVATLPDIVSAEFVKTGKKTRIALHSALQDLKKDARLGTKEIGWAMTHPNRDQNMGEFLADKIADAEKKRRKALREGNTTALTVIDKHLAVWKAKAAELAATKWRYNLEIVTAMGGAYTKDTFVPIGKRASGGPVTRGMPYIVGEKRPELFVPKSDGTILPSVPAGGRQDVYHHLTRETAAALRSEGFDDRGVAGFLRNMRGRGGMPVGVSG